MSESKSPQGPTYLPTITDETISGMQASVRDDPEYLMAASIDLAVAQLPLLEWIRDVAPRLEGGPSKDTATIIAALVYKALSVQAESDALEQRLE